MVQSHLLNLVDLFLHVWSEEETHILTYIQAFVNIKDVTDVYLFFVFLLLSFFISQMVSSDI